MANCRRNRFTGRFSLRNSSMGWMNDAFVFVVATVIQFASLRTPNTLRAANHLMLASTAARPWGKGFVASLLSSAHSRGLDPRTGTAARRAQMRARKDALREKK
jgi:hypothetical protein